MKTQKQKFVVYCRVSTNEQAERGESLPAQEDELVRTAKALGGTVTKIFSQPEHATEGSDRESLMKLLALLERGEADAVIVRDSSRLTRDPVLMEYVRGRLLACGAHLYYGSTHVDLHSPDGKFQSRVLAAMDAFVVERMQDSAAKSRLARAQRGWPHSGSVPYGRVLANASSNRAEVDAHWVLDNTKAALTRRMYELYISEGHTLMAVGRQVGIDPEAVRRILLEQSGDVWVCDFKVPGQTKKIRVEIPVPPLLSPVEIAKV